MIAQVKGCSDCPMFHGGEDTDWCNHPQAEEYNEVEPGWDKQHNRFIPITPDWCPLKKQSLLIKLADA